MEFTIKLLPTGFPLLSQVRGLLRGEAASKEELLELVRPVVNDEFDEVSVTTDTDGKKRSLNIKDAINGLRMEFNITGSEREFVNSGILRGLLDFLKSDVFDVGDGHTFCFQ